MPFPPDGFLAVAKKLSNGETVPAGEGRNRTIAGRSYYAAYLATCEAMRRTHGFPPDAGFPHEALCQALRGRDVDLKVRAFGTMLDSMRLNRIHADYKSARPFADDKSDDSLHDAEQAFVMLPQVEKRLPRVSPSSKL
jgi:hypothetical protein